LPWMREAATGSAAASSACSAGQPRCSASSCSAARVPASAAGTAPQGLEATGDPSFCTLWTLCGMPAVNLPLMRGANGLPLGAQLVGPRGGDARLLRDARWLQTQVASG